MLSDAEDGQLEFSITVDILVSLPGSKAVPVVTVMVCLVLRTVIATENIMLLLGGQELPHCCPGSCLLLSFASCTTACPSVETLSLLIC